VRWIIKYEVRQAIVNEACRLVVNRESSIAQFNLSWIGDNGINAGAEKQPLGKNEFRIKILRVRGIVHDRHVGERPLPALQYPFGCKHHEDNDVEVSSRRHSEHLLHLCATGTLCLSEERGEEGSACIGIHPDEAGTLVVEMKVVAHEGADGAMILPTDGWSP
jgi:hypothetical protein